MKFLGRSDVADFMERQKIGKIDSADLKSITYKTPTEFGRLLASMRLIFENVPSGEWSLAIIESAGIWPSWEDKNLYGMMRRSKLGSVEWGYGEGHLFEPHELADLTSFVTVFTNFRWDFKVINQSNSLRLNVSHDDNVNLFLRERDNNFIQELSKVIDQKIVD